MKGLSKISFAFILHNVSWEGKKSPTITRELNLPEIPPLLIILVTIFLYNFLHVRTADMQFYISAIVAGVSNTNPILWCFPLYFPFFHGAQ